jgi:5-formyltetrahydrofolate cyclo-ligase
MQTTHGGPATFSPEPRDKAALRGFYRQRRAAHVEALGSEARLEAERALATRIAPLAGLPGPAASYWGVGDEIDPRWAEAVLGPLSLPRIAGGAMTFHLANAAKLARGPLSIPQPPADSPMVTPRLLLVPLLAVTREGLRLGQGGGYYDRTLAALRANGPVVAVGLAFDVQIADWLPAETHDAPMDWIATPTQLVACRQSG